MISDQNSEPAVDPKNAEAVLLATPTLLEWSIDEKIQKALVKAEDRAAADIADLDSVLLHFGDFGADAIKKNGSLTLAVN